MKITFFQIDYTTEIPKSLTHPEITQPSIITTSTTTPQPLPSTTTIPMTNPATTVSTITSTETLTTIQEKEEETEEVGKESTVKLTTVRHIPTTTPRLPTTIREVTETHYNFNPVVENRLKQHSVTAGKVFRFVIPKNTFKDFEDGDELTYMLLDVNNRTITNNTWLHYNPLTRELYGL